MPKILKHEFFFFFFNGGLIFKEKLPILGDISFCAFELKQSFSSDHNRGLEEFSFGVFRLPRHGSCSLIKNVSIL